MRGSSERRPLLVGAALLAVLGAFVAARLEVTTDITHFLPEGGDDRPLRLARTLATAEPGRTLLLVLDAPDGARALEAGLALEQALRDEPVVARNLAFLEGGVPAGLDEALWTLHRPRRFGFLRVVHPDLPPGPLPTAFLERAVERLSDQLATPLSGLVARVAPEDPLLLLPGLYEAMAADRGDGLTVVDGRFQTADGHGAVLIVGSRAPAFEASVQGPFLDGIERAFSRVAADLGGGLTLHASGAARFALRAEQAIRHDVRLVSLGSLAGLALLLGLLFRSPRLVLVTLPVVAAGFLAGTAACLLVSGSVHGLTLAFGAALIGVSIDYTVHAYCHQLLHPHPDGRRATLGRIGTGLTLGAATTVVGFVALLVSSFPGMRQMALFAAVGIAAALGATRLVLPGLMARRPPATSAATHAVSFVGGALAAARRHQWLRPVIVLGVLALALLGGSRARWNDDLAALNRLDPELLAEDEAVRERVARHEQGRVLVASGPDMAAALAANDRARDLLLAARDAGELSAFASCGLLLPGADRQALGEATLRDDPTLWPRLAGLLEEAGFRPEAFLPFEQALSAPAPAPLTHEDIRDTAVGTLVRPFLASSGDEVLALSFLEGLHDPGALAARAEAVEGVQLVDVTTVLGGAYRGYRQRMTRLLLVGLAAVVALVALRHRALGPTLSSCLPALLAAAGTVGLLGLAGLELNVLSLVALLMVVSMGVDYGVFLTESGGNAAALRASHLAVLVSGLSTMLGFGLLTFSDHPALQGIGAASGTGIALSLVLAPLLGPAPPAAGEPR